METIFIIGLVIALYFIALAGLAFGAGESTTPTPAPSLDDDLGSGSSMFDDDDSFTSSTCAWCGSITCMGICDHDACSSIDNTSMLDDHCSHSLFDDHCGSSSCSMFDD